MPHVVFDRETHAAYGAAAQLARLQGALEDVSTHLPEDAETERFILVVTTRKNGREPTTAELKGPERHVTAPPESDGR